MSDPIKWLDRDDGPVDYGEPTYWERRCKCHQKSPSSVSPSRPVDERGSTAVRVLIVRKVGMQLDHIYLVHLS